MAIRMFDTKTALVVFVLVALAILLAAGTTDWHGVGTNPNYPTNDCGKNYFFLFEFPCEGEDVQHTRGIAAKDFVDRLKEALGLSTIEVLEEIARQLMK